MNTKFTPLTLAIGRLEFLGTENRDQAQGGP